MMRSPRFNGAALVVALACSMGCQAFAPSGASGLFADREEKRILKMAKADPFPSPADVGLDQPTAVP
jgi:hypothetical protein